MRKAIRDKLNNLGAKAPVPKTFQKRLKRPSAKPPIAALRALEKKRERALLLTEIVAVGDLTHEYKDGF
jgi:hypothetical protein